MRGTCFLLLLCMGLATPAGAARRKNNDLLRVITPPSKATAPAHPFVNVIVRFGEADSGAAADPSTFEARIGKVNVTQLFDPIVENDVVVGMHGELGPATLRAPGRRQNRLRLVVRAVGSGRRRPRDIDRLRFRTVETENQPPVAHLVPGSDVILPLIPLAFSAGQSHDPEQDRLTYHWDFGDGGVSDEVQPTHTFDATATDVTVMLTVSDGQLTSTDQVTLFACPQLDADRTRGTMQIEGSPLEFGALAVGATDTRVVTIRNTDTTPTSQLPIEIGVHGSGFSADPTELRLGPGESVPVTVRFSPAAPGHQSADVVAAACASNTPAAHLLAHGYGGSAPGTGPTLAAEPVFYNTLLSGTYGIRPDGTRFLADNTVHQCQTPLNGPGTGDVCLDDSDCASNGGTCPTTSVCPRGDRAGLPCSAPGDCPNSYCPSALPFDTVDMCGDGEGGLYLLSDEGTYTDPSPGDIEELGGTLLRLQFDDAGNRTVAQLLARTTIDTTQMSCDKTGADAGGQLYLAEFHEFIGPQDCYRDSRETLTARSKSTRASRVLMSRIDSVEAPALTECDDYDPVTDLQVTRDGAAVFASLPEGLYRIRPTVLQITPDIDDIFQLHPDGSVIVVTASDQGTSGLIRVYKLSPDQAVNGALRLRDLTPCATVQVPNNRSTENSNQRLTFLFSYAVAPSAPGSFDGTILVSFSTPPGAALPAALRAQGTVAISSPAGMAACSVMGFINLEALDQLSF
jgi:PKD repeat protein